MGKTLLVKELLDAKAKMTLFVRPRRFGRSLDMDMLRQFFERTAGTPPGSSGIRRSGRQGKYPMISLSFPNMWASSWESAFHKM